MLITHINNVNYTNHINSINANYVNKLYYDFTNLPNLINKKDNTKAVVHQCSLLGTLYSLFNLTIFEFVYVVIPPKGKQNLFDMKIEYHVVVDHQHQHFNTKHQQSVTSNE